MLSEQRCSTTSGANTVRVERGGIDSWFESLIRAMALRSETGEDYWLRLQQYRRRRSSSLHSTAAAAVRVHRDDNKQREGERESEYDDYDVEGAGENNDATSEDEVDDGNRGSSGDDPEYGRLLLSALRNSGDSDKVISQSPGDCSPAAFLLKHSPPVDDIVGEGEVIRDDIASENRQKTFKRKRTRRGKPIGDINAERSRYARSKSFFRRNTVFHDGCRRSDTVDTADGIGVEDDGDYYEVRRLLRSDTDLCDIVRSKRRAIGLVTDECKQPTPKSELTASYPNSGGPVLQQRQQRGSSSSLSSSSSPLSSPSSVLPLVHKPPPIQNPRAIRRASLTTNPLLDECSNATATTAVNYNRYPWRRFKSVPEDTSDTGETLAADTEEKLGLLLESTAPSSRTRNELSSGVEVAGRNGGCCRDSISSSSSMTCLCNTNANRLSRWSRSKIDLLVPSLRSLVSLTAGKLASSASVSTSKSILQSHDRTAAASDGGNGSSGGGNFHQSSSSSLSYLLSSPTSSAALRRNISLNSVTTIVNDNNSKASYCVSGNNDNSYNNGSNLRKCNTMVTLINNNASSSSCVETKLHQLGPLRPVNRLRISSRCQSSSSTNVHHHHHQHHPPSTLCSRCSSLLSMASSSKYSLNSAMSFTHLKAATVLCKVCLNEVPLKDSWTLQHCECSYCVGCVRSYVEFEINEGAYSISCPDAQCKKQGIILLEEIESLVSFENIEKHKRYRLNTEVEMDKSRTWCPRAGCETVCTLCNAVDRTTPQDVRCPTCLNEFCSICKASWHPDSPCKAEDTIAGVTFDSELIKCCPMCSVPIEKDEGCAQMLCKRCKHVFCWYCLASLDDDFLLRHYDKGPCKNKLGHSRASVIWHRTQVISIFAGFGILLLIASPLLLLAAPCIVCCKCRVCTTDSKLDNEDDIPDVEYRPKRTDESIRKTAGE